MERLKSMGLGVILVLFIVSLTILYIAGKGLMSMRPADSYQDKGVYTFVPTKVLPHQVRNTSTSRRYRRMNSTKTEYMIYYQTTDQSRYEWKVKAVTKSSGEKTVEEGIPVERKVLSIPESGTYITVEPDQTAEDYVRGQRRRNYILAGISLVYIIVVAIAGFVWLLRRPRRN